MHVTLKQTREEELARLTEIKTEAFDVQAKYFEDGVLPPFPEDETLDLLFRKPDITVLSVWVEDEIAGGVVIKRMDDVSNEIMLFFIAVKYQGRGVGRAVLQMVEARFPQTKRWRLITPTQVLRNSVFYVNKCGYNIVRVEDFDKRTEHGIFVFEKRMAD